MSLHKSVCSLALLLFATVLLPQPLYALDWNDFSASVMIEASRGPTLFTCTGVAITPSVVLTAAHCMQSVDSARVTADPSYDKAQGIFIPVVPGKIYIHPGYDPSVSLYAHDIAAVVLSRELAPIRFVPILPKRFVIAPGDSLELIGFGGRGNQNIRTWTEVFYSRTDSATVFTQDSLSVHGDSGGPLYYRIGGSLYLLGIHSTAITDASGAVTTAAVDLRDLSDWLKGVTR